MDIPLEYLAMEKEIGRINTQTGEITVNPNWLISYTCSLSGDCCTRFHIPITDFDIARIEDHGYDIFQIVESTTPFLKMPKTEYGSIEKNYKVKRKPFTQQCTFMVDDKCSIHEFKPFACRIFPFQLHILGKNTVSIQVHDSNFCPSIKPVEKDKAMNHEILEFLRDTIQQEMEYRMHYLKLHPQ